MKSLFVCSRNQGRGDPCGILINVLNCDIVVEEFKPQWYYYIHFWTNAFEKGMNFLIFRVVGEIIPLLFYKDSLGFK